MKTWGYIALSFLLLASGLLSAQTGLVTHNEFTAQALVKDIFASGACENIDIILPIGSTNGIGYFENASDIIGLSSGIILSTGPTQYANGPNSDTDTSGNFNDTSGDADLNQLATAAVFDAVGISFDFVPLDSFVSFRYVFASEEYCEFVGSQFNDVFGFFISGPGIEGEFSNNAKNLALIPGTDDFVAINSINFDQYPQWYVHNERNEDLNTCQLTGVVAAHLNEIEYDGFTTVMTAVVKLHPCESYHIRLVVGDVSDAFFDSAVFLEAGSFNLGGQIAIEAISTSIGNGQLYEGCEDAFFRFSRTPDSPIDLPLNVNYYLSDASTATSGVDFTPFPENIAIPAGELYVDVPFYSLNDSETEEEEFVRLVLDIPCSCYADSADIVILPAPLMESELLDTYVCPGEQASLSVQVTGGIQPYTYLWTNGSEMANPQVNITEEQLFWVTIADACGHILLDSAQLWLNDPPTAFLSGETRICQGDTAWLSVDLEGVPPFELSYSVDAGPVQYYELDGNGAFPVTLGGQYTLLTVEDAACLASAGGQANVTLWELAAEATIQNPLCTGDSTGRLSVNITAGEPPFQYYWNGENQGAVMDNLAEGLYGVEIIDNRNCNVFYAWEITAPPPLRVPVIDCEALALGSYIPSAQGGTPPYQYSINDDDWLGVNWHERLIEGEEIFLRIQDAHACSIATNWQHPVSFPDGMFVFPPILTLPLGTQSPLRPEWLTPLAFIDSVLWSPADQLSCANCLEPILDASANQSIQLSVTDIFGCRDVLEFDVRISDRLDIFIPNAFSPNGDDKNDFWHIYANPLQVAYIQELLIFDRWGNAIFRATNWPINSNRHGWDGYYRGQLLDPAVFAYSITFRLVNGNSKSIGGGVTLVR